MTDVLSGAIGIELEDRPVRRLRQRRRRAGREGLPEGVESVSRGRSRCEPICAGLCTAARPWILADGALLHELKASRRDMPQH